MAGAAMAMVSQGKRLWRVEFKCPAGVDEELSQRSIVFLYVVLLLRRGCDLCLPSCRRFAGCRGWIALSVLLPRKNVANGNFHSQRPRILRQGWHGPPELGCRCRL
jgi:hypothetical protein